MSDEATPVLERVVAALRGAGIEFTQMHHASVFTSAEAAAIRGTTLHSGAKALILKGEESFLMVVLPADMALDSTAVRKLLGVKRMRFATKEEVSEITGGLTPGSIPPFGSLFNLATICDERLAENERINFNAGSHSDSVQMAYRDYAAYESPRIACVAKPAPPETTSA